MKKIIRFDDNREKFFAGHGLKTFDEDIKRLPIDTYVAEDPKRVDKIRRIILARTAEMSKRRKLLDYMP